MRSDIQRVLKRNSDPILSHKKVPPCAVAYEASYWAELVAIPPGHNSVQLITYVITYVKVASCVLYKDVL